MSLRLFSPRVPLAHSPSLSFYKTRAENAPPSSPSSSFYLKKKREKRPSLRALEEEEEEEEEERVYARAPLSLKILTLGGERYLFFCCSLFSRVTNSFFFLFFCSPPCKTLCALKRASVSSCVRHTTEREESREFFSLLCLVCFETLFGDSFAPSRCLDEASNRKKHIISLRAHKLTLKLLFVCASLARTRRKGRRR